MPADIDSTLVPVEQANLVNIDPEVCCHRVTVDHCRRQVSNTSEDACDKRLYFRGHLIEVGIDAAATRFELSDAATLRTLRILTSRLV